MTNDSISIKFTVFFWKPRPWIYIYIYFRIRYLAKCLWCQEVWSSSHFKNNMTKKNHRGDPPTPPPNFPLNHWKWTLNFNIGVMAPCEAMISFFASTVFKIPLLFSHCQDLYFFAIFSFLSLLCLSQPQKGQDQWGGWITK